MKTQYRRKLWANLLLNKVRHTKPNEGIHKLNLILGDERNNVRNHYNNNILDCK